MRPIFHTHLYLLAAFATKKNKRSLGTLMKEWPLEIGKHWIEKYLTLLFSKGLEFCWPIDPHPNSGLCEIKIPTTVYWILQSSRTWRLVAWCLGRPAKFTEIPDCSIYRVQGLRTHRTSYPRRLKYWYRWHFAKFEIISQCKFWSIK
jgi:hypothetical protein